MDGFVYQAAPTRVVFGAGALSDLPKELSRLSIARAMILTTPEQKGQGERVSALLGDRAVGIFSHASMHTPVEVTFDAISQATCFKVDGVVAVGGGSTTGLSKAIALRTDLPQVIVPTSYSGSEMTPILGETQDGLKTTQSSSKVQPETVIYDVDLTMSLPCGLTSTSGMNAIAHAVEALYARDQNPIISLMAEESIRVLARALPSIVENSEDRAARSQALYGAWLAGTCLGAVGMALHHKLCHTLGGAFNLPHSETHSIMLPHVMAYNSPLVPVADARIARALGAADAAQGLYDLARSLNIKLALKDIGMPMDGIDIAADLSMINSYWNPRGLERDAIRDLIARAWAGEPPVIASLAA
jgi:maleylacetate reductase